MYLPLHQNYEVVRIQDGENQPFIFILSAIASHVFLKLSERNLFSTDSFEINGHISLIF